MEEKEKDNGKGDLDKVTDKTMTVKLHQGDLDKAEGWKYA